MAISPMVFIFSVTLLGDAIERSRQEENTARENEKINIQNDIKNTEGALKKAKKDGNMTELTNQLDILKKRQGETEKKIGEIKIKYNRIDFKNTVFLPYIAFLTSLVLEPITFFLWTRHATVSMVVFVLQIFLLAYGINKIYHSLGLVQNISKNKKESDHYDRLKEAFRLALFEDRQNTKEEASLEFTNISFPLNVAPQMELSIPFRVKLTKGSIIKNTSIWFHVADGIDLIDPPESKSWKQGPDYSPPNIRTVKIDLGDLNIGPFIPRTLKIKTPSISGKYLLRYAIRGEGYDGPRKDFYILVAQ